MFAVIGYACISTVNHVCRMLNLQKQTVVFNFWRIRHKRNMCLITAVENSRINICFHVSSFEVDSYVAKKFSLLYSLFEVCLC